MPVNQAPTKTIVASPTPIALQFMGNLSNGGTFLGSVSYQTALSSFRSLSSSGGEYNQWFLNDWSLSLSGESLSGAMFSGAGRDRLKYYFHDTRFNRNEQGLTICAIDIGFFFFFTLGFSGTFAQVRESAPLASSASFRYGQVNSDGLLLKVMDARIN